MSDFKVFLAIARTNAGPRVDVSHACPTTPRLLSKLKSHYIRPYTNKGAYCG